MAVLKRGDNTEVIHLDAGRRFASSFAVAWNLWTAHIGSFFKLSWDLCLVAGIFATLWFAITQHLYFIGPSVVELVLCVLFGGALLLAFSMLRARQMSLVLSFIQDSQTKNVPFAKKSKELPKLLKVALKSANPLLIVWLLGCVSFFVMRYYALADVWLYVAVSVFALVFVPVVGVAQSYMELVYNTDHFPLTTPVSYWQHLRQALGLCRHYLGGMLALWIISFVLLAIVAFVLLAGEYIVLFAKSNSVIAFMQKEPDHVPVLLLASGYLIMFVASAVLMFLTSLWSLPQQIHIRSIMYKVSHRPKRAKTAQLKKNSQE